MKPETKKIFKSARWRLCFISLGMVAAGCSGMRLFEYTSNLRQEKTGINNDDLLAVACLLLMLAGMVVAVLCGVWIIISAYTSALIARK
jgi:hypothetical protein